MKTNRRRFLATLGATASATLLAPSLFDFKVLAGPPFVRPDVAGLSAKDPIILGYETAVAAMKALNPADVRNWGYQAAIHGTTASGTFWNQCQHGTHLFWAWHRMYLYWFERIVRKYSGDSNWALPYWNWTSETTLPPMFRVTTSHLYTSHRNSAFNNGSGSFPASDVDYTSAFSEVNYYDAQSSLEVVPHDQVHVDIGGWMGSILTAAQDPIFYLHHANVDRLWDLWLAQGGGRSDPTSDSTWEGVKFTFFDENANKVSMTPCDVLEALTQLKYSYEGEPAQVPQSCSTIPVWLFNYLTLLLFPFPPTPIDGDPYVVPVDITSIFQQLVNILQNPLQEVFLELDGVSTKTQPGVGWEVYVGLPAGVKADPTSPYYVGKLALFGPGVHSDSHMHMFKTATLRFNATKALQTVVLLDRLNSAPLTFVASGILVHGKQVTPQVKSTVTVTRSKFVVETRKRR